MTRDGDPKGADYPGDYIGIKDKFRRDEKAVVVANIGNIEDEKGIYKTKYIIYGPDGKEYSHHETESLANIAITIVWTTEKNDKSGKYRVEWYRADVAGKEYKKMGENIFEIYDPITEKVADDIMKDVERKKAEQKK